METNGRSDPEALRLEQVRALGVLSPSCSDGLQDLAELLADVAGVEHAAVYLIEAGEASCLGSTGDAPVRVARGGTAFDRLVEDGGAFAIDDASTPTCCVPLRLDGHVVGALWVRGEGARALAGRRAAAVGVVARRAEAMLRQQRERRAEERVRRRLDDVNERLDLVTTVLCDGVWDVDLALGSVQLAPRCFDLLGLPNTTGHVPLAGIWPVVHVRDRRALRCAALRLLHRGERFDVEFRCRHASGAWRWFRARAISKAAASGVERIVGSLTDVHEQRRSQEHLQRVSRLLAESQALARVGGWEFDLVTQHLFWTSETYRIHDTSPNEYTPTVATAIDFYAPEAQPKIRAALEDAIARGRAFSLDLPVITARGRHIWCRATGAAVFAAGRAVRVLGAFQDVTVQRRLDTEMLAAKEAAEAASESKSAFLAAMSHEIRTPMHTVLGYADMLRDSELTEEQRECVEIITSSGTSLLRLIDDILDFSKVEAGKMQLERVPVDLHQAVVEVTRMLQPQAGQKRLMLHVSPEAPCDCLALADPQRVRQVLVNLAGNAVKFTQSGEVALSLECRDDAMLVRVRDTGIGIPADHLPRLFDDFVQVDASTQRQFGGTGLGLAISKKLVEEMGGQIGVESEPGVGSTFWFTLPKACDSADVEPGKATGRVEPTTPRADGVARRVLLAEDNRLNQRLAVRVLETFGYRVDTANDGVEALSLATTRDYDLVLMDCLMPGMDGFEATRRIRAEEQATGRHVPIVALTANAMPEDREACLASGMDDFVSKPFTRQALRQATERWLARGGGDGRDGAAG